jgi:hypothetical protein
VAERDAGRTDAAAARPPEQEELETRLRLHERGLELVTSWVHALREKVEALDARLREKSNEPLKVELARLRSELALLHGYLKASGLRPPETLAAAARPDDEGGPR